MTRISDAIKKDHRELEEYYNKIVNSIDEDEKTRYQNQFTWELARHSHGEEIVVYPAFEKNLANGKSMADKDRDEHQVVRLSSREDIVHWTPTDTL
jgi:hemerythrin superfamily protein